jgi:hypothetical protein
MSSSDIVVALADELATHLEDLMDTDNPFLSMPGADGKIVGELIDTGTANDSDEFTVLLKDGRMLVVNVREVGK